MFRTESQYMSCYLARTSLVLRLCVAVVRRHRWIKQINYTWLVYLNLSDISSPNGFGFKSCHHVKHETLCSHTLWWVETLAVHIKVKIPYAVTLICHTFCFKGLQMFLHFFAVLKFTHTVSMSLALQVLIIIINNKMESTNTSFCWMFFFQEVVNRQNK